MAICRSPLHDACRCDSSLRRPVESQREGREREREGGRGEREEGREGRERDRGVLFNPLQTYCIYLSSIFSYLPSIRPCVGAKPFPDVVVEMTFVDGAIGPHLLPKTFSLPIIILSIIGLTRQPLEVPTALPPKLAPSSLHPIILDGRLERFQAAGAAGTVAPPPGPDGGEGRRRGSCHRRRYGQGLDPPSGAVGISRQFRGPGLSPSPAFAAGAVFLQSSTHFFIRSSQLVSPPVLIRLILLLLRFFLVNNRGCALFRIQRVFFFFREEAEQKISDVISEQPLILEL